MVSINAGIDGSSDEKINKPSFQLCFPKDHSNVRYPFHGPNVHANFVTPKFYTRPVETKHIYDVNESVKATNQEDDVKHRHIRRWPQSSSQSYGWWYDNEKVKEEILESSYGYLPLSSERYGSWYDHAFSSRQSSTSDIRDPMLVLPSEIIHWQDIKLFGLAHLSYA